MKKNQELLNAIDEYTDQRGLISSRLVKEFILSNEVK